MGRKRRKSRSRKQELDDVNTKKHASGTATLVDYNDLGAEDFNGILDELREQKKEEELEEQVNSNEESNGTPTLSAMTMVKDDDGIIQPLAEVTKGIISDLDSTFDALDTTDLDEINSLQFVKDGIGKTESGRTSGNDTDLLLQEIENEIKEVETIDKKDELDNVLQPVSNNKENKETNGHNLHDTL